jgi:hypothetical protein
MSNCLEPIWHDSSLVFQWGDFSQEEKVRLRDLYGSWKIVLTIPDDAYAIAGLALEWFTRCFAAMQDREFFDPSVRVIACYIDAGQDAGCNATAFSLSKLLGFDQPTYAIHVNIFAAQVLVHRARIVVQALEKQLKELIEAKSVPTAGNNCALISLVFVFFHELAHIVRGHLEWTPSVNRGFQALSAEERQLRKILELDADCRGAHYSSMFISEFFAGSDKNGEAMQQFVALVAMYSMFSCLRERDPGGQEQPCYYSPMSRLMAVMYHLMETEETAVNLAATLLRALIEGFRAAMANNPSLNEILDVNPRLQEREQEELTNVTVPKLLELESQGRLNGWQI